MAETESLHIHQHQCALLFFLISLQIEYDEYKHKYEL